MAVHRFLLVLLIAIGVTLSPIGSAMAALALDHSAMADMPDCPNKTKQTSKDCGCCDAKAPCQADLCLAKCFKLSGDILKSKISLHGSKTAFVMAVPTRPPDSWPEPQRRPPRT